MFNELSENVNSIKNDRETIKNNQSQMKNTTAEMKTTLQEINRVDEAQEQISNLKDKEAGNTQSEQQKKIFFK